MLSEGSGFDPRAPRRLALPRSLAAAVGEHLRVLPPDTRVILEMLSVLNLRMPLAQVGEGAQVDSPSAAIKPAVTSGLVDWWPEEPARPVAIRHPLVRDAIYAGIAAAGRRTLHGRAASLVSEAASWSTGWPLWTGRMRAWPLSWSDWRPRKRLTAAWRWPPHTGGGPRTSPRPGPTGSGGC